MNTEETKPFGANDLDTGVAPEHVEVLIEDLFIEDYAAVPDELDVAPPTDRDPAVVPKRRTKIVRTSLFGGLLALAGLAVATLVLRQVRKGKGLSWAGLIPRRGSSPFARWRFAS